MKLLHNIMPSHKTSRNLRKADTELKPTNKQKNINNNNKKHAKFRYHLGPGYGHQISTG